MQWFGFWIAFEVMMSSVYFSWDIRCAWFGNEQACVAAAGAVEADYKRIYRK